ncbi:GNAT family N-acetyltransferase [Arthrobacter gengyunqii]|uniref:GNAT family N-acetyltransferase n=1 Tax=Arthrobacter gengyunqii TaxID=2886940 RepID=A0ABS8GK12_9MICC|nr:GNAT family N-acetyltransferase [Arthrobacter gengyunqii]MCC3267024.1 GNAT family N-acetyltransferase [Arthrobacter gengyunqii]
MTRAAVRVRPPVESDAPRLADIHISAWRAAYRKVMSDEYLDGLNPEAQTRGWRRNIREPRPGTFHLVAETDSGVAGFCILGPAEDAADSTSESASASATGQLYAINVHPDSWAQGVGSALFAAAEEKLMSLGYHRAMLWVEANNERAIDFYTKRGWLDDGGTLQDTRFDPPVAERRHSRGF